MAKLEFHHINIASPRQAAVADFYQSVMGLAPLPQLSELRQGDQYQGDVLFATDGNIQFHLAAMDLEVGFATGQPINPVARGHIGFHTDDIEAVKTRLLRHGVRFADFGDWAMRGWHQIFFHDPAGNVVEVWQEGD